MNIRRWIIVTAMLVAAVAAAILTSTRVNAPTMRPLVAIVSAFPAEIRPVAAALTDIDTVKIGSVMYTRGRLGSTDVVLVVTGAGMVNAASRVQHAIDHFAFTHLVLTGIAGALDPSLEPAGVVVPEIWINHQLRTAADDGTSPLPLDLPPLMAASVAERGGIPVDAALLLALRGAAGVDTGGVGISGDLFVAGERIRADLRAAYDARIVDMESAAVAQVALLNNVPFVAIRAVSDFADSAAQGDIEANLTRAADAAAAATIELVRRIRSP